MRFVQFYTMSTGYVEGSIPPRFEEANKRPIEACGSDGVLPLDGRFKMATCAFTARSVGARRRFVGFTIEEGASYSTSRTVRPFEKI